MPSNGTQKDSRKRPRICESEVPRTGRLVIICGLSEPKINALPEEMLAYILSKLSPLESSSVPRVCRHWRKLWDGQYEWRQHILSIGQNKLESLPQKLPIFPLEDKTTESLKNIYNLASGVVRTMDIISSVKGKWRRGNDTIMHSQCTICGGIVGENDMHCSIECFMQELEQGNAIKCCNRRCSRPLKISEAIAGDFSGDVDPNNILCVPFYCSLECKSKAVLMAALEPCKKCGLCGTRILGRGCYEASVYTPQCTLPIHIMACCNEHFKNLQNTIC